MQFLQHFHRSLTGSAVKVAAYDTARQNDRYSCVQFQRFEEDWEIRKIGQWMGTEAIGNPYLMASDYGVRNKDYEIEDVDAMLIAPCGRHMLDFGEHPYVQDLYFNLYNNIWGCNHPMWYGEDSRFRFKIRSRKK